MQWFKTWVTIMRYKCLIHSDAYLVCSEREHSVWLSLAPVFEWFIGSLCLRTLPHNHYAVREKKQTGMEEPMFYNDNVRWSCLLEMDGIVCSCCWDRLQWMCEVIGNIMMQMLQTFTKHSSARRWQDWNTSVPQTVVTLPLNRPADSLEWIYLPIPGHGNGTKMNLKLKPCWTCCRYWM